MSLLLRYGFSVLSSKSLWYLDRFFTFTNFNFHPLSPYHPIAAEPLFMPLASKIFFYTGFIGISPYACKTLQLVNILWEEGMLVFGIAFPWFSLLWNFVPQIPVVCLLSPLGLIFSVMDLFVCAKHWQIPSGKKAECVSKLIKRNLQTTRQSV